MTVAVRTIDLTPDVHAIPVANPTPNSGEAFKHSDATRLLCAAAYLDHNFRSQAIKTYIEEEHKAVAPSFGIDQVTILRHCLNARRLLDRRDLWLLIPCALAVLVIIAVGDDQNVVVPLLIAIYVAAMAFVFTYRRRAEGIVRQHFLRGKFVPDETSPDIGRDLDYIRGAELGNVLIYSGFTPFVGSGLNLGGWSFAVDLRKTCDVNGQPTQDKARPEQITLSELYKRLDSDIRSLDLDGVTIEDRLYVNGRDIRDDNRFLKNALFRPENHVDKDVVARAMTESSQALRHYRCIRVVDWSGELIFSMFFRLSKFGHNLFAEASYFLLTPVAEKYRTVDSFGKRSGVIADLFLSAISTPFLLLFSPLTVFARVEEKFGEAGHRREKEKEILENRAFDYGASSTLRQDASSGNYRRYFQKLDKEMYAKILERTILDSIIGALEEKNIDVSDLKQRQTTILNNGVMVSGGNVSADNLAVGQGAKITEKIAQIATKAANG